jgi:hypothetical protein
MNYLLWKEIQAETTDVGSTGLAVEHVSIGRPCRSLFPLNIGRLVACLSLDIDLLLFSVLMQKLELDIVVLGLISVYRYAIAHTSTNNNRPHALQYLGLLQVALAAILLTLYY